jgi:hypothetical protein
MAEIYNPWQQPTTDNDISFAAEEFSEGAEHEHEHEQGEMLAEALSVIDSQSRTIQKLMALLTGDQQDGND